MKKITTAILIVLCISLTSCAPNNNQELLNTINQQQEEITNLQSQINSLTKNYGAQKKIIESLEETLEENSLEIMKLRVAADDGYAYLSFYESGYSIVSTDIGNLIISLEDIEPYLNGYNIKLSVGNPLDLTFNGLTFSVNCSESYFFDESNEYSTSTSDKIYSGTWNTVILSVPNINEKALENLRIAVSSDSISLSK